MATTKAKKAQKKKNKKKNDKKQAKAAKSQAGSKSSAKQARAAGNGKKSEKAAKTSSNGKRAEKPETRRAVRDASPKDKRQLVQERKILRSQSRWLQKALFALAKAEDDQEKLAEVRGEKHEPMAVTVDGNTHELGAVTDSLRDSVMERLEALRVTLRNEHALMG